MLFFPPLSKTFFSILVNSSFLSIPSHHPSFPPFKSATGNGGVSSFFSACFVHPTLLNHLVPEKFRRYATSALVNPDLRSSSFACSVITLTVIIASRLLPHDASATVMQVFTRSLHALSRVSFSLCRCDVCLPAFIPTLLQAWLFAAGSVGVVGGFKLVGCTFKECGRCLHVNDNIYPR